MVYSTYILIAFVLCIFLLYNGPLWFSTKLRIFNHGPQSPKWLNLSVGYASRVFGIAGLVAWLAFTSQGNVSNALLLGVILFGGMLLLLNVPLWLATHIPKFKRGSEVSVRVKTGYIWFSRIIGSLIILSALFLALWL